MIPTRHPVLLAAISAALLIVACDEPDTPPELLDYQYVVNQLTLPATFMEAFELGVDLDGDSNARPDNQLGQVIAAVRDQSDLPVQSNVDRALDQGQTIALIHLAASTLESSFRARADLYLGEDPSTPPCSDIACGQHFDGETRFETSADGQPRHPIEGLIFQSRFRGDHGQMTLELPLLAGQPPLTVDLIGVVMEADVSEDGLISGKIGAALPAYELETTLLPLVVDLIAQETADDCSEPDAQPGCCTPGSDGELVFQLLDGDNDCLIDLDEILTHPLIGTLLIPDVDLLDARGVYDPALHRQDLDGVPDSLSLGVGFTAVGARFDLPR